MSCPGGAAAHCGPAYCSLGHRETRPCPLATAGLRDSGQQAVTAAAQLPGRDETTGSRGSSVLTPLHIDAAGFVLVDEGLHLLRPGRWEEQGVEARVSLLLIDEFGQVLLGHVGFSFSMAAGQERGTDVVFRPRGSSLGRKELPSLTPLQAQPKELTKK